MYPRNQRSRFVQPHPQPGQFGGFPRNAYQNRQGFSNSVLTGPSVEMMQQQQQMLNQNTMSYQAFNQPPIFYNNNAKSQYVLHSGMMRNQRMVGQQLIRPQHFQNSGQFQHMHNVQRQPQNFVSYSGSPRHSNCLGQNQIRHQLPQGQRSNSFSPRYGNTERNFKQGSTFLPKNKQHFSNCANTGVSSSLRDLSLSPKLKTKVTVEKAAESKDRECNSTSQTRSSDKKYIGDYNAVSTCTKSNLKEDVTSDTEAKSSTETKTSKSPEENNACDHIDKTRISKNTAKEISSSLDSSYHKDVLSSLKTMAEQSSVNMEESQNKDEEENYDKVQKKDSNVRSDSDDCGKVSEKGIETTDIKTTDRIATIEEKTKSGTESVNNKSAVNKMFAEVCHFEVIPAKFTVEDKVEEFDKQKLATNETNPNNNKHSDTPSGMVTDVSIKSSEVIQEHHIDEKGDESESQLRFEGPRVKDMLESVSSMTLTDKKFEEYNVISRKSGAVKTECIDGNKEEGCSVSGQNVLGNKSDGELAVKFKLKPVSVKLYRWDKSDELIKKDGKEETAVNSLRKKNVKEPVVDITGNLGDCSKVMDKMINSIEETTENFPSDLTHPLKNETELNNRTNGHEQETNMRKDLHEGLGRGKTDIGQEHAQSQSEEDIEPMETTESGTMGKESLSPALYQDFVDEEDDYDDVDDDESDDDVLSTAPAFLKSIDDVNTAFGKSQPESPDKPRLTTGSGQGVTKDSPSSSMVYHSPLDPLPRKLPVSKSKFTLDNLLAEHVKNLDHKKEMDVIKSELKADIQQGGFVEILNREEKSAGDLLLQENQQEVLRQFKIEESNICYDRPGVNIFGNQQYLCLFDGSLHPIHCGFMLSGKSQLAKHLSTVTPGQYRQLLTTSVISMCFSKLPCQAAVLKWLFFLMSVEENDHICQRCEILLQEILHKLHTQLKCFPDVYDLLSVLVNYGADLETLIPNELFSHDLIRLKLHQQAEYHKQQEKGDGSTTKGFRKKNLLMVLHFLALSMYRKSVTMCGDELTLLLMVLCKASLDTALKHSCGVDAFQTCVVMTIKLYTDSDWEKQRLKISGLISSLTDHHHNMASIAELLPSTGARGLYLQRNVGYRMLLRLLKSKERETDVSVNNVQIRDLHEFVGPIKELLINDPYKLSSIVTILDVCVGINLSLKSKEREDLKDLIELVNSIRVQDNVSVLDRTRVKDMLVRLTSSWSLDVQTMKGKQTKIFEYAVHESPVKMKIETVETRQSDNDTVSDSQSDEDEMPCKIQKL